MGTMALAPERVIRGDEVTLLSLGQNDEGGIARRNLVPIAECQSLRQQVDPLEARLREFVDVPPITKEHAEKIQRKLRAKISQRSATRHSVLPISAVDSMDRLSSATFVRRHSLGDLWALLHRTFARPNAG